MEFQTIEYTKCCHRLYSLLQQSTFLDLVGEPWFKMTSEGLFFCSRSENNTVVQITIYSKKSTENFEFSLQIQTTDFAPLKSKIEELERNQDFWKLSQKESDLKMSQELGDFFRIHYKKFH